MVRVKVAKDMVHFIDFFKGRTFEDLPPSLGKPFVSDGEGVCKLCGLWELPFPVLLGGGTSTCTCGSWFMTALSGLGPRAAWPNNPDEAFH
jgi:hypothetical protein